jgi:hypothetical protein
MIRRGHAGAPETLIRDRKSEVDDVTRLSLLQARAHTAARGCRQYISTQSFCPWRTLPHSSPAMSQKPFVVPQFTTKDYSSFFLAGESIRIRIYRH